MAQYQAAQPPRPATYPGKTLGIVGLILAIIPCTWVAGLIVSIIGLVQSRGAGFKNPLALAGVIIGVLWLVLSVVSYATGFTQQYMPR